jgi:AcrR family transcriptional regulator
MVQGLRERKKLATRAALAAAAVRLATERGVDRVTVEDIALAADVSPRTFFNHFAAKEESFVADDLDRARSLLTQFRSEPEGAPLWATLTRLMGEHLSAGAPTNRAEAAAQYAVRTSPAVLVQQFRQYAELEADLIAEIGRRTGQQAPDLQPRLMAACLVAAMRSAMESWLMQGGESSPLALFDEGVSQLSQAFPQTRPKPRGKTP